MKKRIKADRAEHYDKVTMAWQYLLGMQFHFGYFTAPQISLAEATLALNDVLLGLGGKLSGDLSILDVGCGIGSPAFYINEKFGCSVIGISTSREGVNLSNARSRDKNLTDRVRFLVADGTDNQFPDCHFDAVWLMESSHTIKDKRKLFQECFRTLKPGGQLFLGDIMSSSSFTLIGHFKCLWQCGFRYVIGLIKIKKAFGPSWGKSFHFYTDILDKVGYQNIVVKDVGEYVRPTFACWKRNARANEREIRQIFTKKQLNDFLIATDLLDACYRNRLLSYGLICAIKPALCSGA